MSDTWKHLGMGTIVMSPLLAIAGFTNMSQGLEGISLVISLVFFSINFCIGTVFPDIDHPTTLPHRKLPLLLVPTSVVSGILAYHLLISPVKVEGLMPLLSEGVGIPLSIMICLLILLLLTLIGYKKAGGHRNKLHSLIELLKYVGLPVFVLYMGFSYYTLGPVVGELRASIILGANAMTGFMLGTLLHRFLDK